MKGGVLQEDDIIVGRLKMAPTGPRVRALTQSSCSFTLASTASLSRNGHGRGLAVRQGGGGRLGKVAIYERRARTA